MVTKEYSSCFPASTGAAAWKGVINSAIEVEGNFPRITFRGGEKCFDVPKFQLREP